MKSCVRFSPEMRRHQRLHAWLSLHPHPHCLAHPAPRPIARHQPSEAHRRLRARRCIRNAHIHVRRLRSDAHYLWSQGVMIEWQRWGYGVTQTPSSFAIHASTCPSLLCKTRMPQCKQIKCPKTLSKTTPTPPSSAHLHPPPPLHRPSLAPPSMPCHPLPQHLHHPRLRHVRHVRRTDGVVAGMLLFREVVDVGED